VTGSSTKDLQITWQRMDGLPLTGQVTQLSKTTLQLFIERVSDTVHYQCIANNSLGINAMITRIDVTSCVPKSPSITRISCNNDTIYIVWKSVEIYSNLLITAFIVKVNKMTYRVSPSISNLEVDGCEDSVVSVTAENDCGRSIPAMAAIYITTLKETCKYYTLLLDLWLDSCVIILATSTNTNSQVGKDQLIIVGIAMMFVLSTSILTIIILVSWRKINLLKKQLDN